MRVYVEDNNLKGGEWLRDQKGNLRQKMLRQTGVE
jgi:hypothetical protein